ncbi:MAG: hypothetical protein IPK26_09365 [Planctomycetes bacterium]|nr:hypothetical protein [Planctomycetota bacterium]
MTTRSAVWPLLLVSLAAGCSSKITENINQDLRNQVDTIDDCLPPLFEKVQALLDFADTWRLTDTGNTDPAGVTFAEQPDGTIDVDIVAATFRIDATVSFFSPTGVLQDLNLGSPSSLAEAIDTAADELRNLFGSSNPFMVGAWQLSGTNLVTTNGAFTGIIGGSTNQNELEELRTTTATPAGGPPPNADGTIETSGTPACTLVFNTTGLLTDETPTQEFPIGTLDLTVTGPSATVDATMTFDGTAVARITVTGINGRFDFNLNTRDVTFVAGGN